MQEDAFKIREEEDGCGYKEGFETDAPRSQASKNPESAETAASTCIALKIPHQVAQPVEDA
jgi:hypothetical protein